MIASSLFGSSLWKCQQVDPGDTRIGDQTDHGIGFTLDELIFLMFGVKLWEINTTGVDEWWNSGYSYQPLPADYLPNKIPNQNTWTYPAPHDAGRWNWPDWNGGTTDTPAGTTWTGIEPGDGPCPWNHFFDTQEKYLLASGTGFHATGGPDSPTRITMGFTTIYFDGTLYYPSCRVMAATGSSSLDFDIATDPANFDNPGVGVVCGTLTILGKSTNIYCNADSFDPVNIEWVVSETWD